MRGDLPGGSVVSSRAVRNCPQCGAECASAHQYCPVCGFPVGALRKAAADPLIGRTLGGAYVILENIGSGGMGKVYRAEQTSLGKTVAIKVIHPHLISDENATSRFWTEARASSRLNHPNSVSVLEFGKTDDGLLYLVMEYLRGKDLAHVLWEEGPLPSIRAVGILRQVLAALSEAHEYGIIHRDIKPENVLIERLRTGNDFVKVVDFGLAKVRADVAPSITMPGIVCGTPDYMAPEQGRGDPLDQRSDLYSCAVLMFQLLTGRLPFEAESPTQMVLAHIGTPPPDPRSINPTIPAPVVRVLLKGLSKEPDDRYPTAVAFALALEESIKEDERERDRNRRVEGVAEVRESSPPCPSCGAATTPALKFCGECGARLTVARDSSVVPERVSSLVPPDPRGLVELPFMGRERELSALATARARATLGRLLAVRIQGEHGSGKRRLVQEFTRAAQERGDLIVWVGPDVRWAGVCYSPVANAVRELLGGAVAPLLWLERELANGASSALSAPAVRAGFEELFGTGPAMLDGLARREAVLRAFSAVLETIAARRSGAVIVLVVEQWERVDPASQSVFSALVSRPPAAPVLLLGMHPQRSDPRWEGESLALKGFSLEQTLQVMGAVGQVPSSDGMLVLELLTPDIPPLFVEQLARWALEGGGPAPSRLVDLTSVRLERLPIVARRTIQALSLLGEATSAPLSRVLGEEIASDTLPLLVRRGWIVPVVARGGSSPNSLGEVYQLAHPLLREVTEASIPAEARAELYRRCAELFADERNPLEVRALLADQTGDPFRAFLLLEQLGDRQAVRGDDLSAALAYRRGLDRARRELLRGELEDPEGAMAIFARKLGEVLVRLGENAEAEGVLREGLELLPPQSSERARLAGLLARALFARGRAPDAVRLLEDAVKTAKRTGPRTLVVELLMARARMEEVPARWNNALQLLREAEGALREAPRPSAGLRSVESENAFAQLQLSFGLHLARVLRELGDDPAAARAVDDAREIAQRHRWPLEEARCDEESAERFEARGNYPDAVAAWKRAVDGANSAGDAISLERYRARERGATATMRGSVTPDAVKRA